MCLTFRVLESQCKQVFVDKMTMTDEDRYRLLDTLCEISTDHAQALYKLFCAMVSGAYDEVRDIVRTNDMRIDEHMQLDDEDIQQFINVFLIVGPLVDYCADAIELSVDARSEKWNEAVNEWNEHRSRQLSLLQLQKRKSAFAVESRCLNKKSFEKVRQLLLQKKTHRREWEIVIVSSLEELKRLPPSFWNTLQFNKLSEVQVRATIHKLQLFQEEHALPQQVVDQMREIEEDIFVTRIKTSPMHFLCPCRRRRRKT